MTPSPSVSETPGVKHISLDVDDVPVIAPLLDRRRTPDRRATWRGGRRDSDWTARPLDGLSRYATEASDAPRWRQMLSSLHIFNV